jgi:hypothetical protein
MQIMIRNLKVLGLALAAMATMNAMNVGYASATDYINWQPIETAFLTGTSHDNAFAVPGASTFECTTSKFTGTIENGSKEATALAAYNGTKEVVPHTEDCTGLGHPTIDMNHCHYKLTGNTTQSDEGTDAVIWVECGEKPIQITTTGYGGVVITVPSQTPTTGGVTYENVSNHSGGMAIKVKVTATGLTYSCHPTFLCTLGGLPHHGDDATYTGTVIVTGYEDLDGTLTAPTEGNRLPIRFLTE